MKASTLKKPRSWPDALRKPCIESFCIEEESEFVWVELADGWWDKETRTITLHCHYENESRAWQEALAELRDRWECLEYNPEAIP